jgi:hypothetical protein
VVENQIQDTAAESTTLPDNETIIPVNAGIDETTLTAIKAWEDRVNNPNLNPSGPAYDPTTQDWEMETGFHDGSLPSKTSK